MVPFRSALEVARAIREKDVSPVEVCRAYLGEVDKWNGELKAFIWKWAEDNLANSKVKLNMQDTDKPDPY
jgi:amidase